MRISSLAILFLSLIIGCAASAPQVKTELAREREEIDGVAESFHNLVASFLIHYVSLKAGLELENNEEREGRIELISNKESERIILRVTGLELSSQDILSQPVRAELALELKVIDGKGVIKYEGKKAGTHEVSIDVFMETEAKKHIADLLVKDALKKFVNDPDFKKIMAKHKYGTLGSIVSIF